MPIRIAGYTSARMVRRANQDVFTVLAGGGCGLVADGMGGLANGGADAETVTAFAATVMRDDRLAPRERLLTAFNAVNAAVDNAGCAARGRMGAVALAARVRDGRLYFAHAGDVQLHLFNSEVVRYFGCRPSVEGHIADYDEAPLPPAACFVMNSDVVTRVLSPDAIGDAVAAHPGDPAATTERVICRANAGGAGDIVTVVVGMRTTYACLSGSHAVRRVILIGLLSAGTLLAPVIAEAAK